MESLSAPYLGFRVYLDTHELVSFMTNPPYAFDLPPTLERDVEELLKHVNALLNDCGGTVCVHCSLTCPVTWLDEVLDHRWVGVFVCVLVAERPSNMLVYLRDRSAHTI